MRCLLPLITNISLLTTHYSLYTYTMKTNELRTQFLNYFNAKKHTIVPSSSLVPGNDPTLLFTNAGMVQFKDVFTGLEKANYTRATSSQRCVRAGGKHNDLENVGYTARHHTFFEMLGNFSFGDYFKREAIRFAWGFLTEVLKLPEDRLWVTVYKDDFESEDIWLKGMGVSSKRFSRCGEKDNFWSMGETGPCGPCTEIFYDHGSEIAGGPPGSPDEDGDRYIEVWNLVFMQFNRKADGELEPLPAPSVDTGMGLERIAAVMQGVHNNYDIDLFQSLLKDLAKLINFTDISNQSMRVIADHIRSAAFLIMDGVVPSNEGRGYVLRRIIRRAVRHGNKLGCHQPFFHQMVQPLIKAMGDAYPELVVQQKQIEASLLKEEEQFFRTLANGLKVLDHELSDLKTQMIPGDLVFTLYDTYGFPADLTADIARERGLQVDQAGFDQAMAKQRARSQQASHFSLDYTDQLHIKGETAFTGYEGLSDKGKITAMFEHNNPVKVLKAGDAGIVVLDKTPFYAESGGQVGDKGFLIQQGARFQVEDTQKHGAVVLHLGKVVQGQFALKDVVTAEVSPEREEIKLNHSATHLLHAALQKVLGGHVKQKGSLVDAQRLRFDFAHTQAVTQDELKQIERLVNEQVRANQEIAIEEMDIETAKQSGAQALFGEKYGDRVRVISMGEFSCELCGGTHAQRTGDIGLFKITAESGIAAGVRRIEAVTGSAALDYIASEEQQLQQAASTLKVKPAQLMNKLTQLLASHKELERELNKAKQQQSSAQGANLAQQAVKVGELQVLACEVPGADRNALRQMMDQLKNELKHAAIILASVKDDAIQLIAGVTKSDTESIRAPQLLKCVTDQVGGKGGGRPDLAQGGGEDVGKLAEALASVPAFVESLLN